MARKKAHPSTETKPQAELDGAQAASAEAPPPEPGATPFPVVGIGASAGGLAAFEAFLSALPGATTGMAFLLVQHLSPDHKSILGELVGRHTAMAVLEAQDGMRVEPDHVYVIPPDRDMACTRGVLRLYEPAEPRGMRTPVDFLFRSLARDQGERAICIVLSGTGSDGTLGVRMVKGEGGLVLAQAPDTTEYDGMPRSAIATGLVDFVLPPESMPARLQSYVDQAFQQKSRVSPGVRFDESLQKILAALRAHTTHDFSSYKESTVIRRLERRMAMHRIERPEDYLKFLRANPVEMEALFRDLLIGVTSFFRDPAAFEAIRKDVVPALFAGKGVGAPVRLWVCGCSTGEEAYTYALLVRDYLDDRKMNCKVQIFATDIDQSAIETARKGAFSPGAAADIPAEILARYFVQDSEGGAYRVHKLVRDMILFSEQDVIKDPPLSRMDLISCRNLLIYMNLDLQKRVIPLFHYALNPDGFLVLGSSETVGEFTSLFSPVNRKMKVYQRRQVFARGLNLPLSMVFPRVPRRAAAEAKGGEGRPGAKVDLRSLAEQALLDHYVHAAVLVNGRGEIQYILGRSGKFLEPAPGDPSLSVLAMAREGLRRGLANALHRAISQREETMVPGLLVQLDEGQEFTANVTVRPVPTQGPGVPETDLYLVILEEAPAPAPSLAEPGAAPGRDAQAEARISGLEEELRAKEEYLQTTLEEMGTSNEELKSTNEELQSVNEELGSTNEELETSKEELQSVNEELATVNAELQNKVAELSLAYNDINSLLSGTGVGILVLDNQLRVSRFTPAITQVINLIPSDVGRPVEHLASNLVGYEGLGDDLQAVLDSLTPRETEVQVRSGAWFLMRIRPYRTMDHAIEGVVITCVDITGRKEAEDALRDHEAGYLNPGDAGIGVILVDLERGRAFLSPEMRRMLGSGESETDLDRLLAKIHPEDSGRVRNLFQTLADPNRQAHLHAQWRILRPGGQVCRLSVTGLTPFRDCAEDRTSLRGMVVCVASPAEPAPPRA